MTRLSPVSPVYYVLFLFTVHCLLRFYRSVAVRLLYRSLSTTVIQVTVCYVTTTFPQVSGMLLYIVYVSIVRSYLQCCRIKWLHPSVIAAGEGSGDSPDCHTALPRESLGDP